jgi:hypothetical protein
VRPGRSAVELSVRPLIALIHKENLGDPHPVLAGGEEYVSHRYAREAERSLRTELTDAGLADRSRLADFTGMMSIIQTARTEFYGWVAGNGDTYAALVAANGRNAFALTRHGDRVRFRRVEVDRLAEALVERLPEVPPGRGESISVREAEVTRSGPGQVMRRASGPARAEQARRIDALLRAPRRGVAKLYAAQRDDTGNRVRSREWLTLLDLPEGRWAVYATTGRSERAVNAVAATPALVATRLTELQRQGTLVSAQSAQPRKHL